MHNRPMDIAAYRQLLAQARRLTRRADEAEDLVQDTLLAALEAGRDDPAWLSGVLRNLAAMSARTAVRRRRREDSAVREAAIRSAPSDESVDSHETLIRTRLLQGLPPAARRVAALALHGLSADEIRWILAIEPTAFRQRLTRIRRALQALPAAQRTEVAALAHLRDPPRSADLPFGRVRRALKAALRGADGVGGHDGDGHLLILRSRAHNRRGGGN